MDVLSCKTSTGRKAAIFLTNFEKPCKVRNLPRGLTIRCSEASAQRSSEEPQLKCSSNSSAGIFTLLASSTVFPASLRFVWFNKRDDEDIGEETEADLNISLLNNAVENGTMESREGLEGNDQATTSGFGDAKIDENNGLEKETVEDDMKISSHSSQCSMLKSSAKQAPAQVTGRETEPGSGESNAPVNVRTEKRVQALPESENGTVEISSYSDSNQVKSDDSDRERGSNWVVKILELRSYWKDQKKNEPIESQAASLDQVVTSTQGIDPSLSQKQICCPSEKAVNNKCEQCDHNCTFNCRGDDFFSSVIEEDPCIKVTHDRDSFLRFLHPVALPEVKAFAQMSFLCNLAYAIPQIKPGDLWKYEHLQYITSSVDKKIEATAKANELKACIKPSSTALTCDKDRPKVGFSVNPAVAYEIAASTASYLQSQTKYFLPFQSGCDTKTDGNDKLCAKTKHDKIADEHSHRSNDFINNPNVDQTVAAPDVRQTVTESSTRTKPSTKVSAGRSKSEMAAFVAASSVTALVAAKEETKQATAKDLQSLHSSPCEWFICDDSSSHTRFFVIQGSESLASWLANLFFEPTQFEGYGVLVHRGIYEAAKGIYEQLLPEVLDYLRVHGETARLRFTGHSLGGSISVLLSLMFLIRGIVPSSSLLPVITFGSPCIMCGGDYLLQKLGLSNSHIQAIMIHRDIVPRAFACNYPDHVAEVLKRLNGNFRKNPCLNSQKLLYGHMGQLLILQPDEKVSPAHPLIPSGCGLYTLHHLMHGDNKHDPSRTAQIRAAVTTFFNSPHPLETLSDPGAYGSDGSISRNHDVSSYLRAINDVLWHQTKCLRRLQREQRRQLWQPLVSAQSSMLSQETSKVRINMDNQMNMCA